jgi:hypothetical protein
MEDVSIPILCPFGQFSGHLTYFMNIWHIFCSFGTFFPVLVSCPKKNLATLLGTPLFCIVIECSHQLAA